jgi:hypothetical protein
MPQLALAAVGAAIGGATITGTVLGMSGAALGWMAGSMLGSALFAPKNKATLADMRVPKLHMGSKMHRVYGTVRVPLSPRWQSEWRATENEAGGKGGGGSEFYTYSCDILYWISDVAGLPDNLRPQGVSRIWWNGELVWSALAESDAETLEASQETDKWSAMTFYDGNAEQLPWPVYEEALGAENADAHRGVACLAFENLQTGTWTNLPLIEVEVYTEGTEESTETLDWTAFKFFTTATSSGPSGAAVDWTVTPQWVEVVGDDKTEALVQAASMMIKDSCAGFVITHVPDTSDPSNLPTPTMAGEEHVIPEQLELLGHYCPEPAIELDAAWLMIARASVVTSTTTVETDVEDLADIVSAECLRSGLTADDIDVSELVGIDVRGFVAQGSAREAIEDLMAVFYFYAVCSDKLYFKLLDAASVATIPNEDTGAGVDQPGESFAGLERGNDLEVPSEVTVISPNPSADYDPGAETSDRLVTAGRRKESVNSLVVLTPEERKGRANAIAMDTRTGMHTASLSFDDTYAQLEPGDVIVVYDEEGNSYTVRMSRESYAQGVHAAEIRLFNRTDLVLTGTTADTYAPVISLAPLVDTELVIIDTGLSRDEDDGAHILAAVKPAASGTWPGGAVYRSADGSTFTQVASSSTRAVFGTSSDALGDFDRWVWDETNTVTVDVGADATLTSSSRSAMQSDRTINLAAIGADGRWEIIRYRTATLVSAGVYTLSGLLRGLQGTDANRGNHASGDTFVKLDTTSIMRIPVSVADIGGTRYWKGVTVGKQVSLVAAQTVSPDAVALECWAPTRFRVERDGSNDATLSWMRRTRLAVRHGGVGGSYMPLGEDAESYEVDVYDDDTFTTVVRTLTSSTESVAYPAATQTSDGLTPGDPINARIYQLSALVGRGYPLEATA